jgi:hypothetical protein
MRTTMCSKRTVQKRHTNQIIVTWRQTAGIVNSEKTFITRQRFREHILAATNTQATQCCKHVFPTIYRLCFLCGPCKVVIKKSSVEKSRVEFWDASLPGYELGSRGIKLSWQLQNNGKKEIRVRKEDFTCDLKWQWDCYKSVARIRLLKTENPSEYLTVNCKVCRSAIALFCL